MSHTNNTKPDLSVNFKEIKRRSIESHLDTVRPGDRRQYQAGNSHYFFKRAPQVVDNSPLYEIEVACNLLYGYLLGFEHITTYKVVWENGHRIGRISKKVEKACDIHDYLSQNPNNYQCKGIPKLLFAAYLLEEADWNPQNYIFSEKIDGFIKIDHEFSCASKTGDAFKKIYIDKFETDEDGEYILTDALDNHVPFELKSVENPSNAMVFLLKDKYNCLFEGQSKNVNELFMMLMRHVLASPSWEQDENLSENTINQFYKMLLKFSCLERASIETVAKASIVKKRDRKTFIEWFVTRQAQARDFLKNDVSAKEFLLQHRDEMESYLQNAYEQWSEGLSNMLQGAKLDPVAFQSALTELYDGFLGMEDDASLSSTA